MNDVLSNSVCFVYEPDDRYRCSYWLIKHKLLTRRGLILRVCFFHEPEDLSMLDIKLFRPAHKKNLQIAQEHLQSLCLGATLNDVLSNSVCIVYEPDD